VDRHQRLPRAFVGTIARERGSEMLLRLARAPLVEQRSAAHWLAESLRIILLVGNFGAFLFGIVFIARPSALMSLES
jgi:hypothetical protein